MSSGTVYKDKSDIVNEQGEVRGNSKYLTITPSPTEEKPDRVEITLDIERMVEMQNSERLFMTITANGYGKRSSSHEYRVTSRGGTGITGAVINEKTGELVYCMLVEEQDGLVLVTNSGQMIRTSVNQVSVQGRNTRGVKVFSLSDGQTISSVARIASDGTEDDAADGAEDGVEIAHEPSEEPERSSDDINGTES